MSINDESEAVQRGIGASFNLLIVRVGKRFYEQIQVPLRIHDDFSKLPDDCSDRLLTRQSTRTITRQLLDIIVNSQ